jgi:hypothetical protein
MPFLYELLCTIAVLYVPSSVGPKILKIPNATEFGYRARTKRFTFQVLSFPVANVTWKKPYWNKRNDGRFRQENGDLIIENVKYTDSGRYQATARNLLGEVKMTTFLVVSDAGECEIKDKC